MNLIIGLVLALAGLIAAYGARAEIGEFQA